MAITTTTQISAPVNVIFQTTMLRRAKAVCPYFVGTVAAEIMQHRGTFTAKWRRVEKLTAVSSALSELTGNVAFPTRVGVQPSVTDVTATVSKYGNFMFLNEEVDLLNFNETTDELSGILGENAGQSLNRLQRNIFEDSTTAVLSGVATTATNISGAATASGFVSRTGLANVVNALNRQNAMKFRPMTTGSQNVGSSPIRESYWGIGHSDTTEDVRNLTGFVAAEAYASQTALETGEYGAVGGVRFIETSESSIDLDGGVSATSSATTFGRSAGASRFDIYNTVIFGKDAIGSVGFGANHVKEIYMEGDRLPPVMMISHARGSAGAADPLNEISTMGWKSWHAGVVLNSNWARNYRHSVSRLQAA